MVGGGQGGIALGARLRQLGVPVLVVDRWERPGDQWLSRYKSLCLHDPVWYDHLPYLKFPDTWPVFAPKDKIADWLESYTKIMEVPYWSSTTATKATYVASAGQWTVELERNGETVTPHPTHLVMATGMSGKPMIPDFPGAETFIGEQQHCSQHPGPDAYAGKRVVASAATTPRSTSAGRCTKWVRTSRWSSAPARTSSRVSRSWRSGWATSTRSGRWRTG